MEKSKTSVFLTLFFFVIMYINNACYFFFQAISENIAIYIYKIKNASTHPLTQYLFQSGTGDSTVYWITNFGVQIGLGVLTSTNMGFCEIPPLLSSGARRHKHVSKHNSAPNYLTMTKLIWID